MNDRQLQLIKYLLKSEDWMTASALASHMKVSVRSVKNYVAELNRLYPGLILSSPNGYQIQEKTAPQILGAVTSDTRDIPQNNKERTSHVIIQLLRAAEPLDAYDLCDQMFISMSTLRIVLKRVKRQLSQYQLSLSSVGDMLSITGSEQNRRQMLRSIIFSETNITSFDPNSIQEIFDNIDTEYALDTLNEILWKHQYYVTDFSAYNILLHIVIAVDRSLNSSLESEPEEVPTDIPDFLPAEVLYIAEELTDSLSDYYGIRLSRGDTLEFALLILSRATSLALHEVKEENLEDYIGHDCMALVHDLFARLSDQYGIDLNQSESRISFALHIKSLMIRARTRHFNRNPITESIKTSCPMIYDVAVNLSSVIAERIHTNLIDDEIAYIAFHIGNAIEMQMAYDSKISVILNCPTYYNMKHDLSERLTGRFGKDIIIENITVSESQLSQYEHADLILSTVPLKPGIHTSSIQIHPFLTMADAAIIDKALLRIKAEKRQAYFFREIRKIILPEFCEHLDRTMTKEETLRYMCRRLFDAGFATEDFEKAVFEREQLSSTVFTDFAIPHAMTMQENRSCMYILINDQPIQWDENEVRLVIMLCFSAVDRQVFYTVFEPLSGYLLKHSVIQQLLKTHSYEEVMEIIAGME